MQYMLLIYEDERNYGPDRRDAPLQSMTEKHMAFSKGLGGAVVTGAGLLGVASATTVRTANGTQSLHDGPFAETKEQLGGFYMVEASDLDAAIAIARKTPLLKDGAIEIRPVLGAG